MNVSIAIFQFDSAPLFLKAAINNHQKLRKKIMKKNLSLLAGLTALLFTGTACHKPLSSPRQWGEPEGDQAGNEIKRYSSRFAYVLTYSDALQLSGTADGKTVTLDNRDQAAPGETSKGLGHALLVPVIEKVEVDVTPPKVRSITWKSAKLEAGKMSALSLEVEEEGSGVSGVNGVLIEIDDKGDQLERRVPFIGKLVPSEKKGWFTCEFFVPAWAKPGTYELFLQVSDAAGNYGGFGASFNKTYLHPELNPLSWRTTIENSGKADLDGPKVLASDVPKEIIPGKEWEIRLEIIDDLSGVLAGPTNAGLYSVSGFGAVYFEFGDDGARLEQRLVPKELVREKDSNWFRLRFPPSHYLHPGKKVLRDVRLSDRAGNKTVAKIGSEIIVKDIGAGAAPQIVSLTLPHRIKAGEVLKVLAKLDRPLLDDFVGASLRMARRDTDDFPVSFSAIATGTKDRTDIELHFITSKWMARGSYSLSSISSDDVFSFYARYDSLDKKVTRPVISKEGITSVEVPVNSVDIE